MGIVKALKDFFAEAPLEVQNAKHEHKDCTNEEAMAIFRAELAAQKAVEPSHGPAPMGTMYGIDGEAIIIGTLCLISTFVAVVLA